MRLDRKNINTQEFWNSHYANHARGGWLNIIPRTGKHSGLRGFLYPEIKKMGTDIKILEIGGGDGKSGSILKQDFPHIKIWNSDLSDIAIEHGKQKYPEINHFTQDVRIPFDKKYQQFFDVLICQEVIEHLDKVYDGIKNMIDTVSEKGLCCFTYPWNEGYNGSDEHLWTFDFNSIHTLFFDYAKSFKVCDFQPFQDGHFHFCVLFRKNEII